MLMGDVDWTEKWGYSPLLLFDLVYFGYFFRWDEHCDLHVFWDHYTDMYSTKLKSCPVFNRRRFQERSRRPLAESPSSDGHFVSPRNPAIVPTPDHAPPRPQDRRVTSRLDRMSLLNGYVKGVVWYVTMVFGLDHDDYIGDMGIRRQERDYFTPDTVRTYLECIPARVISNQSWKTENEDWSARVKW